MLALNRGENYADTSAQRLRGGELCVERMQTQASLRGCGGDIFIFMDDTC